MQEFLSMGGYGGYVWPSYILTAVVLGAVLVVSVRGLKATEEQFKRLKQNQETETPNGDEA